MGTIAILLAGVLISGGIVLSRQEPAGPVYTLDFLDENGDLLEQVEVPHGGCAIPPELEHVNDSVSFRCWHQRLYNITASTELRPVYQDLRQYQNVFYMDTRYAKLGERVEAELWLGGKIRLSAVELTLLYDPEVLLDFQCDTEGSPFRVTASEPGSVTLCLDSDMNLTEAMTAATIRFVVSKDGDDLEMTKILMEMHNPAMITEGGVSSTDGTTVQGEIYFLS